MNAHQRRVARRAAGRIITLADYEHWVNNFWGPTPGERVQKAAPGPDPELRARKLLRESLLSVQRDDFDETFGFNVRAADGRLYRIHEPIHLMHNNIVTDDEVAIGAWPRYTMRRPASKGLFGYVTVKLPISDVLIGQKLYLESRMCYSFLSVACTDPLHHARPSMRGPMLKPDDYGGVI